jgi:hypothetical protein
MKTWVAWFGFGDIFPAMEPKVDRSNWKAGQRVVRKDSDELGTVVEAYLGFIKVRWDSGSTSYYRPGEPGNVKLAE